MRTVPTSVHGEGNPTIAVPGLTPTFPVMVEAPLHVTVVPRQDRKGTAGSGPGIVWASAEEGVAREKSAASPTPASRRTHLHNIQILPGYNSATLYGFRGLNWTILNPMFAAVFNLDQEIPRADGHGPRPD